MSKDAFPIDAAQVVGLFMECVFYGCIRVLLWSDKWFKPFHVMNKKMITAALLMFVFASLDVAFHLRHNLEVFIYFAGNSAIEEFDKTSNWLNVMGMACYVAQTFVGDAILIFRCWVVYSKNWLIIILPILLWLATTVCGAMTIYIEATMGTSGKLLNSSSLVPFITSMLCLTLVLNILTTGVQPITSLLPFWTILAERVSFLGLIVYRIWSIQQGLKHRSAVVVSTSPLRNVVVVLIESGVMYTVSIIILFGLYMASNNGQYGVSNAVVQIIGITFNLIITSVDRKESIQPFSYPSHISHQNESRGGVPLHMINIQTTISHFPDDATPTKSAATPDSEERMSERMSTKNEWESKTGMAK
ncbi:hypothetical protein BDN70DRAFT_817686 [Pholiota conissans]|uniref:Uncharacterized protein n=1 Tax=Pholiota conissans TaxID=109636 RepID=A0A9P5YR37_9AGAR|nr:hypothetical protein BDN70DRAFT_817686 [Pholiota conissans]